MTRMNTFAELPFERKARTIGLIIAETGLAIGILFMLFMTIRIVLGG